MDVATGGSASKDSKQEDALRICMFGSANVGKTTLVKRMLGLDFSSLRDPSMYEIYTKTVTLEKKKVVLEIQDMAGGVDFPGMREQAISESDIFLIVFALNNFHTCKEAIRLCMELTSKKHLSNSTIMLIGNKCDLFAGEAENKARIATFMSDSVEKTYLEYSGKYENGDRLLTAIHEQHRLTAGPARVTMVPATPARRKSVAPKKNVAEAKQRKKSSISNLLSYIKK